MHNRYEDSDFHLNDISSENKQIDVNNDFNEWV